MELAVSLPALVLLVFAALTAVTAVRVQLECVDGAREVARAVARGGPVPAVRGEVAVTDDGDLVRATVSVRHRPLGGRLPGFDITATAVAVAEPERP